MVKNPGCLKAVSMDLEVTVTWPFALIPSRWLFMLFWEMETRAGDKFNFHIPSKPDLFIQPLPLLSGHFKISLRGNEGAGKGGQRTELRKRGWRAIKTRLHLLRTCHNFNIIICGQRLNFFNLNYEATDEAGLWL